MSGPIAATGAISNPTRYGALNMGSEQFTGLWTQRSPYRDAATAYLIKKFYQGSRFDSILDGINREISARLTDIRRPGTGVFNSHTFTSPGVNSFYSWKYVQNGAEVVRVLADMKASGVGVIDDVTVDPPTTLITKSGTAGKARFLGIGTELFVGDGVDQKKVMTGAITWQANTAVAPGALISVANGASMQMALGGITMTIVATSLDGDLLTIYIDPQNVPTQFANIHRLQVTFAGLTVATFLNGTTIPVTILSSTLGIMQHRYLIGPIPSYAEITDTGTGTTGNGVTGGSAPTFSSTPYDITADAGQQWKCYGPFAQNWGLTPPTMAPSLNPVHTRYWQANTLLTLNYAVLDPNQRVQVVLNYTAGAGGVYKTGRNYPNWTPVTTAVPNPQTIDGTIVWLNMGAIGRWAAATAFATFAVILDSNQNLQYVSNGGGGNSGGAAPAWATTVGATTADGALTWTCLGAGVAITTDSVQYRFALHAIDGSVSTASPAALIQGPILGTTVAAANSPIDLLQVDGAFTSDAQLDQIWIYRTPQGQSIAVLEDQIPMDDYYAGSTFDYQELGIPDVSDNGSGALSAFIIATVAKQGDPPPAGFTGPVLHLQKVWGFVGNKVYYSAGSDAVANGANGFTAFPPLNVIAYQAQVIKILPITVENGALLVFTTSGIKIVLGLGTTANPFYSTSYCEKVNLGGYDALDVLGTEIYMMEASGKVSSLLIRYPFDPQSGYSEVGFPIGDQFKLVTTGGISSAIYDPANTFVSWNVGGSGDTALYVADGAVGWFRLAMVNPPETGLVWSPRAAIANGTSAVQSVETSPGVYNLLIGHTSADKNLRMRDATGTIWADNGTSYASWNAKGVNVLCPTGQWTEVAHISAKSRAVGSKPVVSVLLGEITPSATRPWNVLDVTSVDPPDTPRSVSVYSDRYGLAQNGVPDTSDCILTKFDYGTQSVGDELLDWSIFAATEDERKEEAQK